MRQIVRMLLLCCGGIVVLGCVQPQQQAISFSGDHTAHVCEGHWCKAQLPLARKTNPFGLYDGIALAPTTHAALRLLPRMALDGGALQPNTAHVVRPGNFPFQTAKSSDGLVIVHFYQRPNGFAQDAVSTVQGYLQHPVQDTLGETLKQPVNIYFYNSRSDFLAGAQPGNAAETGAYTEPATNSIYMPITGVHDDDANAYLPHELTHLVFHQNANIGHLEDHVFRMFPLWLDEGMAEHDTPSTTSGGQQDLILLEQEVIAGKAIDFLQNFVYEYPADSFVDGQSYAEARSFIDYLITTYGVITFHQFVNDVRDGEILLAAERDFGSDLQTLQNQWRIAVGLPALAHDGGNGAPSTTGIPYVPGHVPTVVAQTKPFDVAGQDMFSSNAMRFTFLLTLLALLAIVAGWFQLLQRRQRFAAVHAAETLLAFNMANPLAASTVVPFPSKSSAALPRLRWPEMVVFALFAPIILIIEVFGGKINASLEWSQSFRVAEFVAGAGIVALLALTVIAALQKRMSLAHIGGVIIAIITLLVAAVQGSAAGLAQGKAYESQGAYAMAVHIFTNAGVGGSNLARAQAEWGEAAFTAHDYGTAVTQLRAAVTTDPTASTTRPYRTALNAATDAWGQALAAAQQFDQALQVYQTQAHSDTCDITCQGMMQNGLGTAYLSWATALFVQGQQSAGLSKVAIAVQNYPNTAAGRAAKQIQAGINTPFAAGIAASNRADTLTMNVLLTLVAAQQPTSANAAEASEVPEPVTGSVQDASGASVAGDQIFFLGFVNKADALKFSASQQEVDVTKATTTMSTDGTFTVRLEPGLWYLPMWDDPSQSNNNYVNISIAKDLSVFQSAPYRPTTVGNILGV